MMSSTRSTFAGSRLAPLFIGCLIVAAPRPVLAQDVLLGRVVEANTERPIPGVDVVVTGTTRRSSTDDNGVFRLPGGLGDEIELTLTRLGYAQTTRRVRPSADTLVIEMAPAAINLEQIVVTGTAGGVSRRALSNSVGVIDAAEEFNLAPVRDMSQLLAAKAPGLQIFESNGSVGTGTRLNIRGFSSLALPQEPVIYLDGIRIDNANGRRRYSEGPGRLNDINPDDVDRIEFIRGPAAATLYGSEASSGVIQIFTKSGHTGTPFQADLTVRQGASWFRNLDGRFPLAYYRDPTTGNVTTMNLAELEKERGTPIYRTGYTQGYHLGMTGGTQAARYYLSSDYDGEQGISSTNKARRFSGRANLTVSPTDALEVQTNFGLSITRNVPGASFLGNAANGSPKDLNTPFRGWQGAPPEYYREHNFLNADRFTAGISARQHIGSWFTHHATVGLDLNQEQSGFMWEKYAEDDPARAFVGASTSNGRHSDQRRRYRSTTIEYGATADFERAPFTFSTSAGAQYFGSDESYLDVYGLGFATPGVTSIFGAATQLIRDYRTIENTEVGVYVQEQVGWKDQIYVTGALRVDDNSAFGANFDLATYPKLGVSWIADDPTLDRLPAFETLKLRASYGESGRQPDAYAAVRTFKPVATAGGEAAVTPDSPGNPDLGPERGKELELGFEASLLKDRLGMDFTFYNQQIEDVILLESTPPSDGFTQQRFVNGGELTNKGVELVLTGNLLQRNDFDISTRLNLAYNKGNVENLGDTGLEYIQLGSLPPSRHQPGYAPKSIWGRRVVSADLDSNGQAINILCDGGPGASSVPCADAPLVYLGQSLPPWRGGFSTTVNLFGKVRLFALLDYEAGAYKYDRGAFHGRRCTAYHVCEENAYPERFNPVRIAEIQLGGTYISTDVVSTDFVKLRELSAQFELPQAWLRGVAERASVTLSGRNLYTWTKDPHPGWDPESFVDSSYETGLYDSGGLLPPPAQFLTTFSISF